MKFLESMQDILQHKNIEVTSKQKLRPMHHQPWKHWLSNHDGFGSIAAWAAPTIMQYQLMYFILPQPMLQELRFVFHQFPWVCKDDTAIFKEHVMSNSSHRSYWMDTIQICILNHWHSTCSVFIHTKCWIHGYYAIVG